MLTCFWRLRLRAKLSRWFLGILRKIFSRRKYVQCFSRRPLKTVFCDSDLAVDHRVGVVGVHTVISLQTNIRPELGRCHVVSLHFRVRVDLTRSRHVAVGVCSVRRVTQAHAQAGEGEHLAEVLQLPVQCIMMHVYGVF